MKLPVTLIVPVKNEQNNIAGCLDSVKWADEIFVVDSNSEDRTAEIAVGRGAKVFQFHYDGGWPKKKNWAINSLPIQNDWIMIIDADERVSEDLRDEIAQAILRSDLDGYYIRWRFVFLNRWMRYSWSHGWMLRLFRKGRAEYEDVGMRDEGGWDNEVHENMVAEGSTEKLKNFLLHESNDDLSYWIAKQNQFSTWNAVRRMRQVPFSGISTSKLLNCDPRQIRIFLKSIYMLLPMKPLLMFIYLYIFRFGFLDGIAGYYFCALRASHELNIDAKIYELRIKKDQNETGSARP